MPRVRATKTITTINAITSEICEHAKYLFISKGETQAEDLKCHTALKIHTAFCWVMSGRCFARTFWLHVHIRR